MSIIENAKNLKLKIEEYNNLRKKGDDAETFEEFAGLLEPIKNELDNFKTPLNIMMGNEEIKISHKFNTVDGLAEKLIDLKDRYSKNPKTVLDPFPKQDVGHFFTEPLEELVSEIEDTLSTAWKSWTGEKTSSGINEETLDVLSVAGLKGVSELNNKLNTIKNLSNALPSGKNNLEEVESLGSSIRSAWDKLDAPADVIKVLYQ